MTARFYQPRYPGGRRVLRSGQEGVGAVFPPAGGSGPWRWRMWTHCSGGGLEGTAPTELAAKNALLTAWRDKLARMGLREIADGEETEAERDAAVAAEREECARLVETASAWKFYSYAERDRVAGSIRARATLRQDEGRE